MVGARLRLGAAFLLACLRALSSGDPEQQGGGWASVMTPPPLGVTPHSSLPLCSGPSLLATHKGRNWGQPEVSGEEQAQVSSWPSLLGPGSGGSGRQGPGPALTGTRPLAWSLAQADWAQKKTTCSAATCSISSGAQGGTPKRGPGSVTPQISLRGPGQAWQSLGLQKARV